MNQIYTKTGDKGQCSLCDGNRIFKDDARIEAIGAIDELNAVLGVVSATWLNSQQACWEFNQVAAIESVQDNLYTINAILAKSRKIKFEQAAVKNLEKNIDQIEKKLPALKKFIKYEGSPIATYLNFSRAVCRRAERRVVSLSRKEKIEPNILAYLNRLSDYLFVLARVA